MKRAVSLLLCAAGLLSALTAGAGAAGEPAAAGTDLTAAEALYSLGLFRGVGAAADGTPVYALERTPTRGEALIMLVRALGREREALGGSWSCPFSDVTGSTRSYVGYAYAKGITNGVSKTSFGAELPASEETYLAFMLRALGYSDTGGADFTADAPYALADGVGLLPYGVDTERFTRGGVAVITRAALTAFLKGTQTTLLESLVSAGAVDGAAAKASGLAEQSADPGSDAFSAAQDGNFKSSGMVAWDRKNTYLLCKADEKNSGGNDIYRLLRRDRQGNFTVLYDTGESSTRLCQLSLHDGKLYFNENTSMAAGVHNPYYHLVELNPETGEKKILFSATYFMHYCWYNGRFYVLYPTFNINSYDDKNYSFVQIGSGGQVDKTLLSGLTFQQASSFDAYGRNGRIYMVVIGQNSGDKARLCTYDLSAGTVSDVMTLSSGIALFRGDEFYYVSYDQTNPGSKKSMSIWHVALSAPGKAGLVAARENGEAGALLENRGSLYFAGHETQTLYRINPSGGFESVCPLRSRYSLPVLFDHYAIVPTGGILDSRPEDVTLCDLDNSLYIMYLAWLGQYHGK